MKLLARHELADDQKRYRLRLPDTESQRNVASLLINERYSWRGYGTSFHLTESPSLITLAASDKTATVGMVSLGIDLEVGLLQADELYKEEIAALRLANCKLCEVVQFDCDGVAATKQALGSLFHLSFIYGFRVHQCTDMMIEANPRQAAFYKDKLGFKQHGPQTLRSQAGAPAVPVVLLRLESGYAERMIKELGGAGRHAADEKSLYPYFFSEAEEKGLTNRLRRFRDDRPWHQSRR